MQTISWLDMQHSFKHNIDSPYAILIVRIRIFRTIILIGLFG